MDIIFANAFNSLEHITCHKLKLLHDNFNSFEEAWAAGTQDYINAGFDEKIAQIISEEKQKVDPEKEFQKIEDAGIQILSIDSPEYPELLKEIHSAPQIIYVKGKIIPDMLAVAVVGARKCSDYGVRAAQKISSDLAQQNICIVSGLAQGIDTNAHLGALEVKACLPNRQGKTIAVLGSGLKEDLIFPKSNKNLAKKIIENGGAIISEYSFETPSIPERFPQRNRIISGLSKGTVVIEAAPKSGSLITAKLALDQNREVCAVPGSIFSENSQGTNELIKLGAHLVQNAQDVMEALEIEFKTADAFQENLFGAEEKIILDILTENVLHMDDIIKLSGFSAKKILPIITKLELDGFIKKINTKYTRA
jgi:DNA processing protein